MPESGGEVKVFEGGSRSITLMYLKGNVCESDNMQFCDKVYLDLKPECPRTPFFCLPIPFYVSHKETVQYRYCTFDFRSKRTVWMK